MFNVLSLFDGISCGQLALKKLGVSVDKYYASEIDKYAIKVTQDNFPNTIQLGDVTKISASSFNEPIDLLIGGSPCQGFSRAGFKLEFKDERSKLIFEYIRLVKELKPKYFLLENVYMKQDCIDFISQELGVEPVRINSSIFSAQKRDRLYWTNTPLKQIPEDKGVKLKDILDTQVDSCYNLSLKEIEYMNRVSSRNRTHWDFAHHYEYFDDKGHCVTANISKGVPFNVLIIPKWVGQVLSKNFPVNRDPVLIQKPRGVNPGYIQAKDGKTPPITISAFQDNNVLFFPEDFIIRKLTPEECERLQTIPTGYTKVVSRTRRYELIGNSFTVDVISFLLQGI
jgi:DNA-cytosine methyltransferase